MVANIIHFPQTLDLCCMYAYVLGTGKIGCRGLCRIVRQPRQPIFFASSPDPIALYCSRAFVNNRLE